MVRIKPSCQKRYVAFCCSMDKAARRCSGKINNKKEDTYQISLLCVIYNNKLGERQGTMKANSLTTELKKFKVQSHWEGSGLMGEERSSVLWQRETGNLMAGLVGQIYICNFIQLYFNLK